MLDNHGDMVGSLGCGNGVPAWFQKKAAPNLIGKPLVTGFPYSLVNSIRVDKVGGYDHCGSNATMWAQHAGDPNYNLLNECCQAMNSGNPGGLGYTTINQATMDYMVKPGAGRDAFVRYWSLMAQVVAQHPSAFAAELMNEPMSIRRKWSFQTWKAVADAITAFVPDMSVAVADVGESDLIPDWVSNLAGLGGFDVDKEVIDWMKTGNTAFYAWHGYQGTAAQMVKNAKARKSGVCVCVCVCCV